MNQILDTGDNVENEYLNNNNNNRNNTRSNNRSKYNNYNSSKKVLPAKTATIILVIFLLIFGLGLAGGAVYFLNQLKLEQEKSINAEIELIRDEENNTILIKAKHEKGLQKIAYKWNDGEEIEKDLENVKEVEESIDIIGGENTLKVYTVDIYGKTQKCEKTFIGKIPDIQLKAISNAVKVIVKNEDELKYLKYSWDNGKEEIIELDKNEYDGILQAPKGRHLLKIEVMDINNVKAKIEQTVIGDTEPTLGIKLKYVGTKLAFEIHAEDDENIKSVKIIHNGGKEKIEEVNEKTYSKEIMLTEGEMNTLQVEVTNATGLQKRKFVRYKNK